MAGVAESDSDTEYEIRKLSAGEDLVIDGETAIDDLLVAQRIAEREAQLAAEIADTKANNGEAKPSKSDVKNLMSLLRQANELSQRICSLPAEFDGIMGNGVRSACRAAVEAMEKKLPEEEPSEEEGDEEEPRRIEDKGRTSAASQAKALEGLDLESTDEEDEGKKDAPEDPPGMNTVKTSCELDGQVEEAEDDELDEEEAEDDDADELSRVIAQEGFREIAEDSDDHDVEEDKEAKLEPMMINTKGIPESIPENSEIVLIGEVSSVVGGLVVVCSPEGSRALDLQSVVCTRERKVIGVIVDTFGPVVQPFYLVYPTSKPENNPAIGSPIFAAIGLEETSYLCDTASPFDLQEIRRSLLGDEEELGESGDDDDEDDVEPTKDELERKLLADIGPEEMLARAGDWRKGKGKGRGSKSGKGKGKGNKGSKNRHVEPKEFLKDEREGVWGDPDNQVGYGVEDVKEDLDERRQNGFRVKDESLSSQKPTKWKLWRGKKPTGRVPPPPAPPVPPPPPQESRSTWPAPPPPAPPAPPQASSSYEHRRSSTPSRQSTRSDSVSSRRNQSRRQRGGSYGNDAQARNSGIWDDARTERFNVPPPPEPPSASTASASSGRFVDAAASRPGDRRLRRQSSGHAASDDRPFKQPRSSAGSTAKSAALLPPPPPPSASQSSSQRTYAGQRGSASSGRGSVEEAQETAPWRKR